LNPAGRLKTDIAKRKILLIRLRRIGDIVMTTPAVALLKKYLPDASLTYVVEEPWRRIVQGNPDLERVIFVPAKQRLTQLIALIREIRRERYDVLLDFHGGPRAAWISLFSGARTKIGYEIKRKKFLYDIRVPRSGKEGPVHSVENHANLVRAMGIHFEKADIPPLFVPDPSEEEAARVRVLLKKAETEGARLVVLHIGAGNRFRDWGVDNLASLLGLLSSLPGVKPMLVGAEADQEAERRILQRAAGPILPLAGRLSLPELKFVIGRAALFIGPDSGPMHIAASTQTPIVAYFGPTLPAHFAPWRPNGAPAVILEQNLSCRPCRQRECVTDDFRCLRSILPEAVFDAGRTFLL
jgi:lipopolysaccharide heptosyltransferase II